MEPTAVNTQRAALTESPYSRLVIPMARMSCAQYTGPPQGAADQLDVVPALYQLSAIPLDCLNMKANILSHCDPNRERSPICGCFPIPVFIFNESVCATHQRLFSDLRLVFWANSLEYSFSAGPQFDLIKLNSFTLYFASGPLPLCLNNNRSAAEGSSEERGSAKS